MPIMLVERIAADMRAAVDHLHFVPGRRKRLGADAAGESCPDDQRMGHVA
jgi:hypothetical protein